MIQCGNCETAQSLQITQSRIYTENMESIEELSESFECTMCGNTGRLEVWVESGTWRTSITGDIEETDDRPEVSR